MKLNSLIVSPAYTFQQNIFEEMERMSQCNSTRRREDRVVIGNMSDAQTTIYNRHAMGKSLVMMGFMLIIKIVLCQILHC